MLIYLKYMFKRRTFLEQNLKSRFDTRIRRLSYGMSPHVSVPSVCTWFYKSTCYRHKSCSNYKTHLSV